MPANHKILGNQVLQGPKDKFLNDPPESNHQEPALLPEAVGEFTVDTSQPKLTGFVDASCGLELGRQRSIAGCAFIFEGGAIARQRSEAQAAMTSGSAEAKFVATSAVGEAAWCLRFIFQELEFPRVAPQKSHWQLCGTPDHW